MAATNGCVCGQSSCCWLKELGNKGAARQVADDLDAGEDDDSRAVAYLDEAPGLVRRY